MGSPNVLDLLNVALALIKDQALNNCLKRVEDAQRAYLLAEADRGREKNKAIIKAIAQIDIERIKLNNTYIKVKDDLGPDGVSIMEDIISFLEKDRKRLAEEKKTL